MSGIETSSQQIGRITQQVARLNALLTDITASAKGQATGLKQVNVAVDQMDDVTQKNAAVVQEVNTASQRLAEQAVELATDLYADLVLPAEDSGAEDSAAEAEA